MILTPTDHATLRRLPRQTFQTAYKLCSDEALKTEMLYVRSKTDLELFARAFFPHHCRLPFSKLHRHFFRRHRARPQTSLLTRKGHNCAIAAPRGYAKSTIATLILILHDILYTLEGYILIISATLPQSVAKLKNIVIELTQNRHIQDVFAPAVTRAAGRQIIVNGIAVEAHSVGTELRGVTYRHYRPTKIVLDDAENSHTVQSPDQREKLAYWFTDVLENLGAAYTNITAVGTLLHPESLLAGILRRPDFDTRVFRAIQRFAPNEGHWDEWRERLNNLDDPNRIKTARAYFRQHRAQMLHDTRVLWPQKETYYDLMVQLATRGRRAFFKEKQNNPRYQEDQLFNRDNFLYFRLDRHPSHPLAPPRTATPLILQSSNHYRHGFQTL